MVEQATQGRREQILEATLRVIGRSGRESVTHRAVAEEAGVALGSTTYYFDSRDDLLRQALEYVASHEVERYGRLGEELRSVKSARELADRLLSELVSAAEDRVAYIAEYELWLEAGRRPELREAATELVRRGAALSRGGDGGAGQQQSTHRRQPRSRRHRRPG